jgi:hypothetical protein
MGKILLNKGFIRQRDKKVCREFIIGYFEIIYYSLNVVIPSMKLHSFTRFLPAQIQSNV